MDIDVEEVNFGEDIMVVTKYKCNGVNEVTSVEIKT